MRDRRRLAVRGRRREGYSEGWEVGYSERQKEGGL